MPPNGCGKRYLHCGAQIPEPQVRGPHNALPRASDSWAPVFPSRPDTLNSQYLSSSSSSPSRPHRCQNLDIYSPPSSESLHELPKYATNVAARIPNLSSNSFASKQTTTNLLKGFPTRLSSHLKRYQPTSVDQQPPSFSNYHHFSRYPGNIISNGANE
jgi:hypothetical protein